MYPQVSPDVPAVIGGYVPYFYEAGLHQLYASQSTVPRRYSHHSSGRSYSPSLDDSFLQQAERTQTVEQIIAHGYFAVPNSDPITAIISDKQHTSRLGLDDVIGRIRQRYEIHEKNFYQIQLAKTAAINAIYSHEAYMGPGTASSKQHYAKHKAIQGLYEEERLEQVNLWRDVSRLRETLPETAQLYLSAHRKMSALSESLDDDL